MKKRHGLVLVSVLFIIAMVVFVPWVTAELGPTPGIASMFFLYWFGFCLPLGWFFQGREGVLQNLSLAYGKYSWVPVSVAVQVGLIAVASWVLLPSGIPAMAIILALVFGAINGFSEEFFWRGAYLAQSRVDGRVRPGFLALGVVLFGLWHVPLALANGVVYEGGAAALVGSAFALGAFWMLISYKINRIGWAIVAHMLTNMISFGGLIATNFI